MQTTFSTIDFSSHISFKGLTYQKMQNFKIFDFKIQDKGDFCQLWLDGWVPVAKQKKSVKELYLYSS